MGAFFSSDFFGGNPSTITGVPSIVSPTPSSSGGGGSSTTDWLNTIYKFAQLGTQTYLAQDAINSRSSNVQFGPNGQPLIAGSGAIAPGGLTSILGTSSVWLFLFVIVLAIAVFRK